MSRFASLGALVACTNGSGRPAPRRTTPAVAQEPAPAAKAEAPERAAPAAPPVDPVWIYERGARRSAAAADARALGHTVVDLSESWVPYALRGAEYAETFVGLATNRVNADLDDLTEGDDNHLELFGIPPTLSVLRARFFDEIDRPCLAKLDLRPIAELDHDVVYRGNNAGLERLGRVARLGRAQIETRAIEAVQKRLACEGLFPGRGLHRARVYDWPTHIAVSRFERKHMIYGWGNLVGSTRAALAKPSLVLHWEALVRGIAERVVDAVGVVEDGSVAGRRNVVEEMTWAAVEALGVASPDRLRGFWERHDDFRDLRVALRLPPLPDYYADVMDLEVTIDRGDVWYDLPLRRDGTEIPQTRDHFPSLTLHVKRAGEKIPLVRWRTTIGGWRSEWKDDQEYWKYKNSDVGWRVWRHIIAAPVWIPPDTTPPRDLLVKKRVKEGRRWELRVVPNRQELGPGFASAYGLIMAKHVVERKRRDGSVSVWDNQIRTHGSVDYNSILRRYSHGCHRLHNHLALRLFGFVLRHRPHEVLGQLPASWKRQFEWEGVEYEMELRTRGYYYELRDALPVYVHEGNLMGAVKEPIEEYLPKSAQAGKTPTTAGPSPGATP